MTHDILAGIVTYNPDLETLKKNIDAIYGQVAEVVLVDNASKNLEELQTLLSHYQNLSLIRNPENKGIASALNQVMSYGQERNYQWVLTLDQDSVCPENLIAGLTAGDLSGVAIIAPQISYKNNESVRDQTKSGIEAVEWVISSSSLTSVAIWQELGGFDEILFIDGVDRDYCIRAGQAGYKILVHHDLVLKHELGNLKSIRLLGRTIYVTHHSAFRKYYMARNSIYLDKKLGQKRSRNYISKLLLKTLVFENQKWNKLLNILSGIRDGINMRGDS